MEHVVEQRAGVREDDALDRAVADIAFVPQGDVFHCGQRVATQHAGQAGEAFAGDRVALVRHGAGAFLALGKKLLGLEHLGALKMPELRRPPLDARADERHSGHELGVDVALHDLRRDRGRLEAKLAADERLDLWREVGVGADGAGELADGDAWLEGLESLERAAKLVVHQRHLETERRRLGVDAVAASDHRGELVPARLGGNDFAQAFHVGDENLHRLTHLHGKCGVDDIAARQPKVQPATRRFADVLADVGGECDDVVVERALEFAAARDAERRLGLHLPEVRLGHEALAAERLGSK